MEHLGWATAHLGGHSYGALVALQLAIDAPERVASIALLEPAARGISSSAAVAAALQPVFAAYRAGDTAGGDRRLPAPRLRRRLPGLLEQVVPGRSPRHSPRPTCSSKRRWLPYSSSRSDPSDASHVTQPVLNVVGANSVPRFVEGAALVQSWFPDAERLDDPGRRTPPHDPEPDAVADGLKDHFSRHPIARRGSMPA